MSVLLGHLSIDDNSIDSWSQPVYVGFLHRLVCCLSRNRADTSYSAGRRAVRLHMDEMFTIKRHVLHRLQRTNDLSFPPLALTFSSPFSLSSQFSPFQFEINRLPRKSKGTTLAVSLLSFGLQENARENQEEKLLSSWLFIQLVSHRFLTS